MKKLLVLSMMMLAAVAGCNSSTGNDDDNGGDTGNNNNTGNGGKYTVSGSVRLNTANGAGISGAVVVLSTVSQTTVAPLTVTTGSTGAFSFSNIVPGSYIVTVAKDNHTFSPEFVSVTVADKNVVVQTFVGTAVNPSGNAGTSALYPLKANATWTFDSVEAMGSFSFTEKLIEKVTGTMAMGGKTYWQLVSTEYDSEGEKDGEDTAYVRIENNTMYTHGTDFLTAKSAAKAAKPAQAAALLKTLQSGSSEYVLFKFNVAAGTAWDIYKDSGSYQGSSWNVISTGKYLGTETAGTYANCAKYELMYSSESISTSIKIAGKWKKTIWLAPNVGPVKTVEEFYTGESLSTIELLTTVTNTLANVQLP